MTNELFAGSRTKLRRASMFITELETALNQYNHDDPFSARFNHSETPSVIEVSWKGLSPMTGGMLGDAIHNLRAALDLMASELARINHKSDKGVYFPFSASKGEFVDAIRRKNFYRAGDDAISLLITYAPYNGGNELLRAIHDLDIEDKHTAILETEKTMKIHIYGRQNMVDPDDNDISLEGSNIKHYFPQDDHPLAGRPIIETLKELLDLVNNVIEAFAMMVNLRNSSNNT